MNRIERATSAIVVLLCAALLATLAAGCEPGRTRSTDQSSLARNDSDLLYGITETDGGIEAVGILMQIDDGQGLFWAIADEGDPTSSRVPPLIAVLRNPDDVDARTYSGQPVRILGIRDPLEAEDRGVPCLRARELIPVARNGALDAGPIAGVASLPDGGVQVSGEVFAVATGAPGDVIWTLRVPPESSEQLSVMYVAVIENPDDIDLSQREGMVVINARLLDEASPLVGIPFVHAEEVVNAH